MNDSTPLAISTLKPVNPGSAFTISEMEWGRACRGGARGYESVESGDRPACDRDEEEGDQRRCALGLEIECGRDDLGLEHQQPCGKDDQAG